MTCSKPTVKCQTMVFSYSKVIRDFNFVYLRYEKVSDFIFSYFWDGLRLILSGKLLRKKLSVVDVKRYRNLQ